MCIQIVYLQEQRVFVGLPRLTVSLSGVLLLMSWRREGREREGKRGKGREGRGRGEGREREERGKGEGREREGKRGKREGREREGRERGGKKVERAGRGEGKGREVRGGENRERVPHCSDPPFNPITSLIHIIYSLFHFSSETIYVP